MEGISQKLVVLNETEIVWNSKNINKYSYFYHYEAVKNGIVCKMYVVYMKQMV